MFELHVETQVAFKSFLEKAFSKVEKKGDVVESFNIDRDLATHWGLGVQDEL